ncbi:MAG TPA: PAS domain-containing sensor histidine kinase [Clostridiaceae bacterium]|nr:PAS domain-containing sensor histidine kinase [Clostridiaceae bacterium]HBG39740.1 PAS domain-containing sensor histidine kinase [Clostridiaceae bacterium]HBN28637.1 PAS domain-containing sensor histidine kinase [Clostridiaceae bacterium]HBX48321.1 PAS domain-containing sensor histidine kinase [Clostridiaceae bacterium]HCL50627.1 PAS domain-containing sensor histidine kinase [Clostridiaceae bacterium]
MILHKCLGQSSIYRIIYAKHIGKWRLIMFKTLKGKITAVYFCLVLMTAVIGFTAAINQYKLSKSIDGLMVNNYKSINASNNMLTALEKENSAILDYIHGNKSGGIDSFYSNNDIFYKWFNTEYNNITEAGEAQHNENVKKYYIQYIKLFSNLQLISSSGEASTVKYYQSDILPVYLQIEKELKDISLINEQAMFKSKNAVTEDTYKYLYIIIALSAVAVFAGLFISWFFVNKLLKPISMLTETMKSVKEGNLDKQTPILSNDEIGDLTREFNNMTKRLKGFESSTMGKLMLEKNKSIAIVKSISDPLIVLDTNFKVILLNDACEKFFNIDEGKMLNRHFLEAIPDGDLYAYISGVVEDGKEHDEKIISLQSGNKNYYFNIVVNVVQDEDAKMNGIVLLFQNVTQLKQLEKVKTDFISTVSHEFKTPLTSIMIAASLMTKDNVGTLNEKQSKIVSTIKEDTERLSTLITDLLELSKIQSDKSIFNMELCSIEDIILASVKTFHEQAESKKINLYYKVEDNLPKVNVDFEKITWVINNLVSNSLKHTSAGDEISISAALRNGKIYTIVKDTGIGIPEEFQEKIFDKFVQIGESDSESTGSGLGLTIAKEIIEAHDGNIWCESKLGLGSTFTFTLPVANV